MTYSDNKIAAINFLNIKFKSRLKTKKYYRQLTLPLEVHKHISEVERRLW